MNDKRKFIPVLTTTLLGVCLIASQLELMHTQDQLAALSDADTDLLEADAKLKNADIELKAVCNEVQQQLRWENNSGITPIIKPGKPGQCLHWRVGKGALKWGRCDGDDPLPIAH